VLEYYLGESFVRRNDIGTSFLSSVFYSIPAPFSVVVSFSTDVD